MGLAVTIKWDACRAEQRLISVTVMGLVKAPLMIQKQRTLQEKHRECGYGHIIERKLAVSAGTWIRQLLENLT